MLHADLSTEEKILELEVFEIILNVSKQDWKQSEKKQMCPVLETVQICNMV